MKLSQVIEELVEERGLERELLSDIIIDSMLSAYQKRYPDLPISVEYNKKTDDIDIYIEKKIVSSVEDHDLEITLRKAQPFGSNLKLGDIVKVPFEKPIGRIEIIKAKQIISQKIRLVEAAAIFKEFKSREGTIVQGVIHKCEKNGTSVKIQDTFAFLPKSLTIPSDKCVVGYTIRALLKEVLLEPRNDNQLILDRTSPEFLQQLFILEIPEIYEKLIEIKKIARIPGYKSKVLVVSHDKNIDPVGTCVGVGGSRIKPILREIGSEKIDIIAVVDSKGEFIKNALKPADVQKVELIDEDNAKVWVEESQRSIAIGKYGQNISLASELTGVNIDLVKEEELEKDINTNFDDLQ